ncbi:MAG: hypothetical protein HN872_08280 [Gammaproteobacteria bacterium]|nr:hypothetical protein [Gammaproteobacteria bacterium]MBT7226596.1 hypothetical protein [Gammaproteobacteria bacterium]
MEVFDVLILGVELSMALAGFAGIIATFQFRDTEKIRRADVVGLNIIVVYSLLAALQCGVILILNLIGISEAALWTTGSILSMSCMGYNLYAFSKNMKGAVRNRKLIATMWALQWVSVIVFAVNVLNALDIVFHRTPGPFLVGLAWGLGLAGWMFIRLLLLPIWRPIYKQEAREKTTMEDGLGSQI